MDLVFVPMNQSCPGTFQRFLALSLGQEQLTAIGLALTLLSPQGTGHTHAQAAFALPCLSKT